MPMSGAAALRAQVFDLTCAISPQEQFLDDMRTHLEDLQNQLDSIACPVRTLPPEMISEIFIHCLPSKRFSAVVDAGETPVLLTRVCRAWRQIAISTPAALWATFDIEATATFLCLAELAKTWFGRALKCPLSVRIRGGLLTNDDFVTILRQHSGEFRSFELQMNDQDFQTMASHILEAFDFPILEKLSIHIGESSEDPSEFDTAVMFNNVPLLREVLLIAAVPPFVTLPWQQLTKFTGELYSVKDCLNVLRLMPSLLECAFSVSEMHDGDADRFGTVSHPNMQHLALSESTSYPYRPSSAHILTLVTLPALQTLEFRGTDNFEVKRFDSFLERSSPPLRKLSVRSLEGGIALQLSRPFLDLTGLVELEIWRPVRTFVSVFFPSFGRDSSLLPRLQKLAFLGCCFPDDDDSDTEPEDEADGGEILREADVNKILRSAAEPISKRRDILPRCAQLQSSRVISRKWRHIFSPGYSDGDLLPFRKLKEFQSGMDVYIGAESEMVI